MNNWQLQLSWDGGKVTKNKPNFKWTVWLKGLATFAYMNSLHLPTLLYQVCTSFLLQVNDFRIQLLVAVVNYRVKLLKAPRRGLCSNFLSRLREGDRVPIWTKAGTLKFPKEPSTPGFATKSIYFYFFYNITIFQGGQIWFLFGDYISLFCSSQRLPCLGHS